MGRKISVDSATMMNKALEVIEAHFLFDLAPEQIRVVIHPQSVIHSMVVCRDHSVLAQLGTPDMRVPIAYGLAWPDRIDSGTAPLDWRSVAALTFEPADLDLYPGLALAWDVLACPDRDERGAQRRQRGGGRRVSLRNHPLRPDSQCQCPHRGGADSRAWRGRFTGRIDGARRSKPGAAPASS